MSIDDVGLGRGFRNGEVSTYTISLLYSACGPCGQDAVVSLLLKIGLPVDEFGQDEDEPCGEKGGRRTALYRALEHSRYSWRCACRMVSMWKRKVR